MSSLTSKELTKAQNEMQTLNSHITVGLANSISNFNDSVSDYQQNVIEETKKAGKMSEDLRIATGVATGVAVAGLCTIGMPEAIEPAAAVVGSLAEATTKTVVAVYQVKVAKAQEQVDKASAEVQQLQNNNNILKNGMKNSSDTQLREQQAYSSLMQYIQRAFSTH